MKGSFTDELIKLFLGKAHRFLIWLEIDLSSLVIIHGN
ncbi:hypothetical protein M2241_006503 [Bradyrhizobium elkanii]|nr:hypothetical protein [Bradyrhizobium elkanii]MCP1977771.1 hypothetical protein [Bradyrhizobium elkanii]MCS3887712.1 hypothetical protein [Bradyrhizobium elkanii]MCS4213269.1 hypothetical protein [Bradyrhizobium elkanii]MCW2213576.1 hypothetical protein [Bradyrhizobium elkanii]